MRKTEGEKFDNKYDRRAAASADAAFCGALADGKFAAADV